MWWGAGVWSEVQTCIWPSWCHCHSLSLASVKSRLVFSFLVPAHLGSPRKRAVKQLWVCACVVVNVCDVLSCRGICNVSHVSIAWNDPAERHATLLSAVWNMRLPLLRCQHQVWLPGSHWQTCRYTSKNCIALDVSDVPSFALFCLSAGYSWTILGRLFDRSALMTFLALHMLFCFLGTWHMAVMCCCVFVDFKYR